MTEGINEQQLLETASRVLDAAKKLKADAVETDVSMHKGFSVSARNREVETVEHDRSRRLSLTVYFDSRKGSAATSDLSPEAIEQAVQAASDIAKYTARDECAGLADKNLMAKSFPDLDIDQPWDLDIPQAIDVAVDCESAMLDEPHIINTDSATVESSRNTVCYANSHGFAHAYSATRHSISAVAVAGDDKTMHRDYWYTINRNADRLQAHRQVGKIAAARAAQRLGSRKPDTCKTPVLFSPPIARGLIGAFVQAINGDALYRQASFLCGQLKQQVFPEHIQIHEKPHLPGALGSIPFDDEGVGVTDRAIVRDGVLESYVLDNYSGCKLKMPTTGNAGGVSNLIVDGKQRDLDALLAEMDTGFWVTELIGSGTNLVTGDYSHGATGFWVEHGKIQYPIEEATIAGNLTAMFKDIEMVGNDVDERGHIRCGSILIKSITLAGN